MHPKKGKLSDAGTGDETFLMKLAHDNRNEETIAKKHTPMIPSCTRTPIPVPDSSKINSSCKFTLTSSCVSKCYECILNLSTLGEEIKNKHIDNLDHLQNDALKNIIYCRLVNNITSCEGLRLADYHWKFMKWRFSKFNLCILLAILT